MRCVIFYRLKANIIFGLSVPARVALAPVFELSIVSHETSFLPIQSPLSARTCRHGRHGTTSGLHLLGASRVFTRDTPVGEPILLSCASFPLSLLSMVMTKTPSSPPLILVAFTALTTTMGPPRRRPHGCRRNRCSSHGGGVTPRCRPSNPGNADGSSGLYLRGQAATNPGVSILRS